MNQHVRWTLLAQCASNTGAQVPRARLFHSSLIIPSSEISVDHYFLHNFEMLLMTMEIIICYKVLLHLEGFYSPVLFLLAALWHWVKLPSLRHRWEDGAGGLHSRARGPRWGGPKPGLGLCGPLLSGETCICRLVSCGHGGGQQAIQGRCSLCSCWGSPPPTPHLPHGGGRGASESSHQTWWQWGCCAARQRVSHRRMTKWP